MREWGEGSGVGCYDGGGVRCCDGSGVQKIVLAKVGVAVVPKHILNYLFALHFIL